MAPQRQLGDVEPLHGSGYGNLPLATKGITMPLHKTAIAIPEELLAAVDRAARSRRETRNRFVTRVLQEAVRARRDAEVTRRLNELFAEPAVAEEQASGAAEMDTVGTDWDDESW
jgi:metal-responsive CopG/Arc/MetJ family transcriptional regulator